MPKPPRSSALPLFGDEDEPRTKRLRRKRKPSEPSRADEIPDGPCCDTCRNYRRPVDAKSDPFGRCHVLCMLVDRVPPQTLFAMTGETKYAGEWGIEKDMVVSVDEALELGFEFQLLRTRPGFVGCSAYVERMRRAA